MTEGDTSEAERIAAEALDLGTASGQPDALIYFAIENKIVSWQQGTLGDLAPLVKETASLMPGLTAASRASLALSHADGDRFEEASLLLDAFGASGYDLPLDQSWLTAVVGYAEAIVECGAHRHAAAAQDLLMPWSSLVACTGTSVDGPVALYLGGLSTVLGDYDEAEVHLTAAAAFSARFAARFTAARTALWWGRMHAERDGPGDRDAARIKLTEARDLAQAGSYAKVLARAERALDALPAQAEKPAPG